MAATPQHDLAYEALREALLEGRIASGQPVTVASLATMLGTGTMPMREAVRRLTAEGGLDASATRRLTVPALGQSRFAALVRARRLLEPEAAADALPHLDAADVAGLDDTDKALSAAIRARDVAGYMRLNYRFHFGIYRAAPDSVLCPLIESLWLQFGPYMHRLFDRAPAHLAADRHQAALAAIRAGDAGALRAAIAADIDDALGTLRAAGG
jgi:DNA-binding GntR family transcriptional regulator